MLFDVIRDGVRKLVAPPPAPIAPPPKPPARPAERTSGTDRGDPARAGQRGGGTSSASEAAGGTGDGAQLRNGIDKLNGKGDSAYLRLTPEAKVQGNIRAFKVGAKGQLGSDIRVTRDSDDPNSTYTVRYDKHTLAALTGETGTDTVGKGKPAGGARGGRDADANVKAEVGGQTFDAVEMRFASKQDATRAAETLQRLQMADMADDAMDLVAGSAPGLSGLPGAVSGGGSNPAANPLNGAGAPGRLSRKVAGVDEADMGFLRDHVTAYEQTVGSRARLAAEVKGDLKILDGAFEGRADGTQRISRRVELPTDRQDGSVTYSVEAGIRLSAKEKASRKLDKLFGGVITPKGENRQELARATARASLTYALPKGTDPSTSAGGRPVPEVDAASGGAPMRLVKASLQNRVEWLDQGLTDPSRGDSNELTEKLEMTDPARLPSAARHLFGGRFEDAARAAGASLDLQMRSIARSGTDTQPGVRLNVPGLGDAEGSVIVTAGVDDVVGSRGLRIAPGDPAVLPTPGGTRMALPPAPADDGRTYRAEPVAGVNLRAAPEGERVGIVQSGSFLRDEGGRRTDGAGREWMRMSGTDAGDRAVEGWVRADLLRPHSSATGAMDGQGRMNPIRRHERYDQITVEKDDNLWDLAETHGWDFEETVAANRDHIANPSLIFKGDTIYVPGSGRGPLPQEVADPADPPQPGTPGTPSATTRSEGETRLDGTGSVPGTTSGEATPDAPAQAQPGGQRPDPAAPDAAGRRPPEEILREYQVATDPETANWQPKALNGVTEGIVDGAASAWDAVTGQDRHGQVNDLIGKLKRTGMTRSEVDMLDRLDPRQQLDWAKLTDDTQKDAIAAFGKPAGYAGNDSLWQNDGHVDAYRHALWNARMTRAYGEGWTRDYATAHERVAGNPAQREAMDLHNNEVGRRIAVENPNASDADLQRLVREAVDGGKLIVVDRDLGLRWSDQVALGAHGYVPAGAPEAPGNDRRRVAGDHDPTGS